MLMSDVEIVERLKAIRAVAKEGDDEKAHVLEDRFFLDFIKYVAGFNSYYGRKAKTVLLSQNIKFNRYKTKEII